MGHPSARSFLSFAKQYCGAYKNDYGWVTDRACEVAARHANNRVVATLEGGYELSALAASAVAHIDRLMAD